MGADHRRLPGCAQQHDSGPEGVDWGEGEVLQGGTCVFTGASVVMSSNRLTPGTGKRFHLLHTWWAVENLDGT